MSIQSEIDRIKDNVAETYDALEEQGATMPTQKNSNNLAATARTISSGSGGTTVQADWSVNDTSNPRHVRERTHWKEEYDGPEGEIIPETTLQFKGTFNFGTLSGGNGGIQIGGLYIVTHNGTEYRCAAMDSGDGAYIGNGKLLGYGDLKDTGEPFCILGLASTVFTFYKPDKTAETITVKVVGKKETVWHKLDSNYLPVGYPRSKNGAEVLPETSFDFSESSDLPLDAISLTKGKWYAVNWNGVEYRCQAKPFFMEGMLIGTNIGCTQINVANGLLANTDEPFIITVLEPNMVEMFGVSALITNIGTDSAVVTSVRELDCQPLSPAYQPEMVVWFTYVGIQQQVHEGVAANRSYAEMRLAHENGVKITGRMIVYAGGVPSVANLPLVMWSETAMRFQTIFTADPTAFSYVEVTVGDELVQSGYAVVTYSGIKLEPTT